MESIGARRDMLGDATGGAALRGEDPPGKTREPMLLKMRRNGRNEPCSETRSGGRLNGVVGRSSVSSVDVATDRICWIVVSGLVCVSSGPVSTMVKEWLRRGDRRRSGFVELTRRHGIFRGASRHAHGSHSGGSGLVIGSGLVLESCSCALQGQQPRPRSAICSYRDR